MSLDFSKMEVINQGKTKIIYQNPDDAGSVYMAFKDDITAGDGVKRDVIEGKALIDWKTNRDIFELLNRRGVRTHYISSPAEKVSLVKKLDRKINLEVIARRVAAGSILKWSDVAEGARFDPPSVQFHYKDDPLHDPMLDEAYIDFMIREKNSFEYADMRRINVEVFLILEEAFAEFGVQLVDFKLEYGIIDGKTTLIDEITGGSFRLWPYAKENPNLNQPNVISELNPAGRLDKDIYRMGGDLAVVSNKFAEIASITEKFKDL
ncbi:MAG TPA: phosphoribosylaminoimidazolesuccinocarboxamide synthase [bacterium]|nr:MAG: Phosphoribosylaminoimidazole-succinocarboxamide synthase [bacterium ADurb.Bin236]HPI76505.1 phosphoribosylaminoimidazolesuccinocarboxamide synthase [bacterium]HPN95753.1 phosphoribosylaminoimidazolesuccinocarboxamide synthase [bacterium]